MKFLIDAQLPRRLALQLCGLGHDAIHTLDLPTGNRTSDQELIELATRDDRVAVTKDRDFVDSFILRREPPRLLWITTGNVANDALLNLVVSHLPRLETIFESAAFVELNTETMIVHS